VGPELKPATTQPTDDASDPYIPFTVQIRRSTYFALKQAEFWSSGFGEMRTHINAILKDYFGQFPESRMPLPEDVRVKFKHLK
jgi:hypothetical protein